MASVNDHLRVDRIFVIATLLSIPLTRQHQDGTWRKLLSMAVMTNLENSVNLIIKHLLTSAKG